MTGERMTATELMKRIADLERAYGKVTAMCVYWKGQRDQLRAALLRGENVEQALDETRDFGDEDYHPETHARLVVERRPGGRLARV